MDKIHSLIEIHEYFGVLTAMKSVGSFTYKKSKIPHILSFTPNYSSLTRRCRRMCFHHDVDAYSAPLDPYKIIWVNPSQISIITQRERPLNYREFGKVMTGNWDRKNSVPLSNKYKEKSWWKIKHPSLKFEDSILYTSFYDHFVEKVHWEDTEMVKITKKRLLENKIGWADSLSHLEMKCEKMDELYYDIKESGYKTQEQMSVDPTLLGCLMGEIMIDIGRDGQLLHVDGRHRLAISKILDIDRIPVVVSYRHTHWMEHRDHLFKNNQNDGHPDNIELQGD